MPSLPLPRSGFTVFGALVLAALLHLLALLLLANLSRWMPLDPIPARMPVQTVDPKKLEAIKKQWEQMRKKDQRSLLINRDPTPPLPVAKPKDARFETDRNIQVDKETRAKTTSPLARPGSPSLIQAPPLTDAKGTAESDLSARPKSASESNADSLTPKKLPLSHLGLKYRLPPSVEKPKPAPASRAQANGGSQWVDAPDLPYSGQNLLNAQESVYYSFYARLYDAIAPIWQNQIQALSYRKKVAMGTYTTAIELVLSATGELVGVNLIQSSTIPEFDAAATQAWQRIQRFPNPPSGLIDAKQEVRTAWTFRVHVDQGFQLNYSPPQRALGPNE